MLCVVCVCEGLCSCGCVRVSPPPPEILAQVASIGLIVSRVLGCLLLFGGGFLWLVLGPKWRTPRVQELNAVGGGKFGLPCALLLCTCLLCSALLSFGCRFYWICLFFIVCAGEGGGAGRSCQSMRPCTNSYETHHSALRRGVPVPRATKCAKPPEIQTLRQRADVQFGLLFHRFPSLVLLPLKQFPGAWQPEGGAFQSWMGAQGSTCWSHPLFPETVFRA